ncbi:peptidoglycan-N-acetylmuramic acid deacetylase PdaC [Glutamicibacter endophyticus]
MPSVSQAMPRALALLTAACLTLSSCASATRSPAEGQDLPNTSASSTADNSGAPLAGLNRVSNTNETLHLYTSHIELAEHPGITNASRGAVEAQMRAYVNEHRDSAVRGTDFAGELNVSAKVTAASEAILGVSRDTYEFAGASGSESFATQWFSVPEDRRIDTEELFSSSEAWDHVKAMLAEEATRTKNTTILPHDQLPEEVLDDLQFGANGDLIVRADEYTIAPGSVGSITLTLPSSRIKALLSDYGRQAQQAILSDDSPQDDDAEEQESTESASPSEVTSEPAVDCRRTKCVALTFDDGPGPKTGVLLDTLKEAQVPATFFVVGPNAKTRQKFLKRMAAEGHQIGNHTYTHRSLSGLSKEQVSKELQSTDAAISDAIGASSTVMRPPYGAHNKQVDRLSTTPLIIWDVDTEDWRHRNSKKTVDNAMAEVKPGSVILMHDIHESTVKAVPELIKKLKAAGYTPVRIDTLFAHSKLTAGKAYFRGEHPKS